MGRVGNSVVAILFVLGSVVNFGIGFKQNHFLATRAQLLSATVLSVMLIVFALLLPARRPRIGAGLLPGPSLVGAVAFVLGMGVLYTPQKWGWAAVGALLAIDSLFMVLVALISRHRGWSAPHVLGLAAGGALAYGIHAFTQKPLVGGLLGMRISNTAFLGAAIWLICLDARRVIRHQMPSEAA